MFCSTPLMSHYSFLPERNHFTEPITTQTGMQKEQCCVLDTYSVKLSQGLAAVFLFDLTFSSFFSFLHCVVLLFYVHGKHLRSCRDGQLT